MRITSQRQGQSLIVHVGLQGATGARSDGFQIIRGNGSVMVAYNTTASFLKRVKISNLPFRQHPAPGHHFVQHPTEPGVPRSIVRSPDHRPVVAHIRTSCANFVNTGSVKVDHRFFGSHRPNEMVPFSRYTFSQVEGGPRGQVSFPKIPTCQKEFPFSPLRSLHAEGPGSVGAPFPLRRQSYELIR